jgi:hypothetical protein
VAAVASIGVNAVAFTGLSMNSWNSERDTMLAVGRALDDAGAPPTDLLLTADPGGYKYFTGHGGVITPSDAIEVSRQVAADYGIRWLVLQRSGVVLAMVPVLEGKTRPAWIGAPILVVPYTGPKTGDPDADAAPVVAVYPVCTKSDDTRCGAKP